MVFLDEATVVFESGKGGDGSATFHREKFVPRGGPNGADGGRGGDIILKADRSLTTLYDFKLKHRYKADDGEPARGNKAGRSAENLIVRVPVGTVVFDLETGEPEVDLVVHGQEYVICRGGKGGYGNTHFVSSVRQSPKFAQKGAPSEKFHAKLELRLIADVGIVGLPNSGKSTLISVISAAKPKIADYPFTTIVPNLGVVERRGQTFVVADMPGLIAGASEGVGLGYQFLKHIQRTRCLIHLVDSFPIDGTDPLENFELTREELRKYDATLQDRPTIVVLNKIDLLDDDSAEALKKQFATAGMDVMMISAVTGIGVDPLLDRVLKTLQENPRPVEMPTLIPLAKASDDLDWDVEVTDDGFRVTGKRIERLVAMTNFENMEAIRYLHRKLTRIGVIDRLRDAGATEGDLVQIGEVELAFSDSA